MDALTKERPKRPQAERRRGIIDRAALSAELAALAEAGLPPDRERSEVLGRLRSALEAGRAEVRRRFEAGGAAAGPARPGSGGARAVRDNCFLIDQILRAAYDQAARHYPLANPSEGERLAMIAVGGYGRGEMAPFSDVDILFLLPYKMTPRSEQVIESVLYLLWDLGLKVGQAVRSLDECLRAAKGDVTIRTALLESRFLWGDQGLYLELRQRFQKQFQARGAIGFIEAKLAERDTRHRRQGDSRYALEPNIKEGKGGLRDLHTLFWIAKYVYKVDDLSRLVGHGVFTAREYRRFTKAQDFLWTVRCHLHYLAGRAEERLTFDRQIAVAELMGYRDKGGARGVERFMKQYFLVAKDVGNLTRVFCAALEAEHSRAARFRLPSLMSRRRISGFKVEGERLSVAGPEVFAEKPVEMLRIFKVAQDHDLDIHPRVLRWIAQSLNRVDEALRRDPAANRIFMEILTAEKDPEPALRRMNEAGVFGRFIPDFGRVVALMQYNMYHSFTVDEHTLFALGILHGIERGRLAEEAPIASEVVHKVLSRRVLYLAVLLHDIAKGRPGDHSELGAKVAERLGPRLGLSDEETETVAWLVLHHLAMSDTAFKRDIDDPRTIETFGDLVQSTERLNLLLVLTVADIRAVGPNTWNNWKAALLRELYWRTEEYLSGGLTTEGRQRRVKAAKEALKDRLTGWTKKDVAAHLARGYPQYWLSCDTDTHQRHAEMVRAAEREGRALTVETRLDSYRAATEVTVYASDHPGLFSRIAGALAVAGASIDAARIFTLRNGMALDSFYVRDATGGPFERPDRLAKLSASIEQILAGRLRPDRELAQRRSTLPSRYRLFQVQPRVLIDNKASADYTVVEVNGRDRPGLLFDVTLALTKQQLIIHSAKISTYGERAVDVFYVNTALGDKLESEAKIKRLRERLLEALAQPDCLPAAKEPVRARRAAAPDAKVKPPVTKKPIAKKAPAKPPAAKPKPRARRKTAAAS